MRILALFLPLPVLGLARRDLQHEWDMMSDKQITILGRAYTAGLDHGLEETMRAICWQESSAGADLENPEDGTEGSYGWFGINPVIAATRVFKTYPYRPTDAQINIVKVMSQTNFEKSAEYCYKEIEYWQDKYLLGEWTKVWASYNAGYKWKNGKGYARDIKAKIMFLRRVI